MATGRYQYQYQYQRTESWVASFSNMAWFLIASVLMIGGALSCSGCEGKRDAVRKSSAPPTQRSGAPVTSPASGSECPLFGGSDVSTPVEKPEHRVILSWKASVHDARHPEAFGYCVYRTAQQGRSQPTLRVNIHPVPQTTCTDDLVQNGLKYQYEVRAISRGGAHSGPSNVTLADIPFTEPKPHPEGWPPLCREAGITP